MSTDLGTWRRLPIGAELAAGGGVHFRVWAPKRNEVAVKLESAGAPRALAPEPGGYFAGIVTGATEGTRYRFILDGTDAVPDPASRFQPEGPHGPSMVVDPLAFRWADQAWRGVPMDARVVYELHIGTFTREGTWRAALGELSALRDLGVTVLQVMPVSEFPGAFGWGYDGVDLFAPTRLYGVPADVRRFVDRAHALGLAVLLDVVYNHLGPDGNYLRAFADEYFSLSHATDWGEALNFDDAGSGAVRQFVLANVRHWIDEYHFDGLRLDATQDIHDASARHILADIAEEVRRSAPDRETFVVAENEPQEARLVRCVERGGCGLDALLNDDWHHSATVALTGRDEAYYMDYRGCAAELVAAARHGFLYQGQWYSWQRQRRGSPSLDLQPRQLVHFLQNHDQVANSLRGDRLHTLASPSRLRAMTALLLLGPQIPMLFQGQEFAASSPFLYFADHEPALRDTVRQGRAAFLGQFQSIAAQGADVLGDPGDRETFQQCKLDHRERGTHGEVHALHRDLLALRRTDPALRRARCIGVDGAALRDDALALRVFGDAAGDRLLLVNLGSPLHLRALAEPLLAPPDDCVWSTRWSSEDAAYGGLGVPTLPPSMKDWCIPGGCALLFESTAWSATEGTSSHD